MYNIDRAIIWRTATPRGGRPSRLLHFATIPLHLICTVVNSSVLWCITPSYSLKVDRRCGGTCRPHFQGQRKTQSRNQHEISKRITLRLFFDTKNVGDIFLRKFYWLSTDYTALYSRRKYNSS
jgi:hypothetical protein